MRLMLGSHSVRLGPVATYSWARFDWVFFVNAGPGLFKLVQLIGSGWVHVFWTELKMMKMYFIVTVCVPRKLTLGF